jgi:hypothetical protein
MIDPTGYSELEINGGGRWETAYSSGSSSTSVSENSSGESDSTKGTGTQASAANNSSREMNAIKSNDISAKTQTGGGCPEKYCVAINGDKIKSGITSVGNGVTINVTAYRALVVVTVTGQRLLPLTPITNSAQAKRFGLPKNTLVPIKVPDFVDPQQEVNQFSKWTDPASFAWYWRPGRGKPHDYKQVDTRNDAYGNFAYGASAEAIGLSELGAVLGAEAVKFGRNDPINNEDVRAGVRAMREGSTLETIMYTPSSE